MLTFKSKILCSGLAYLTLFWSFVPYLCAENSLEATVDFPADAEAAPIPADEAMGTSVVTADGADAFPAEGTLSANSAAERVTDVLVGKVFTVPEGEDHYMAYGNVRGTFMSDDKVVASFTTNSEGMFTVESLPAGDYTVMAEQERDRHFGSAQVTVTYNNLHEEVMILFLNKCGLARFPSTFDPSLPLAENDVKYWQYVNCATKGVAQNAVNNAANSQTAASAYSAANMPVGYPTTGGMSMGAGIGALGLLGLLGLIGIGPGPVSGK